MIAVLVPLFLGPPPADAGSSRTVAAIGDAAPGGGLFAGPGFSGWPSAAGDSWVAFRAEVTGGSATEALVVAHMKPPASRTQVATLGQTSPGRDALAKCAGSFKQFIGRPIVNRRGEVAFLAFIQPAGETAEGGADPFAPVPAGIFLYSNSTLSAVACSGEETARGRLDLVAVVDPLADPSEIADRSPALNDLGGVAYLAGLIGPDGPTGAAAIFRVALGGTRERVVGIDDPFDGGAFVSLGPPALNNRGTLAFRGLSTDGEGKLVDGIMAAEGGDISFIVRAGITPAQLDDPLSDFLDPVSLNDAGDVAFLAGPVLDDGDGADDEGAPAVLVSSAGVVALLAYPGQPFLDLARVLSIGLGSVGQSAIAPPSIAPDGSVIFFVTLADREVIARYDGETIAPLLVSGGTGADVTPAGGLYAGAGSAPAADGDGGFVFLARIAGGTVSEAIVYRGSDGGATSVVVGDGAPGEGGAGFYGGNPFSPPVLNDRGDVVFRAFLARAPASVGIFRDRSGRLEPVVLAGDLSPDQVPFLDLLGKPSTNQAGAVVFAAEVKASCTGPGAGQNCRARQGIFVTENGAVRTVAISGNPAPALPSETGAVFNNLSQNPTINDEGAVAFRGFSLHRDASGSSIKREAIFLADANGARVLLYRDDPSPSGDPFLRLRDVFLTNLPTVAFRAPFGTDLEPSEGIFVTGADGTRALLVQSQDLGDGLLATAFNGDPAVGPGGEVVFGATRARRSASNPAILEALGPAILKQSATGLDVVVARNMPGPVGGTFRSFGPATLNRLGHVAFRGAFVPSLGGVPGLFRHDGTRLHAHVLRGDRTPLGGRFASFGSYAALNASDELAFSATVTQGRARRGIFLASPTTLTAESLTFRLKRGGARGRVRLRASLSLGRISDGIDPEGEPVAVSLLDGTGPLWSVTIPARSIRRMRGGAFVATPRPASKLGRQLRNIRLRLTPDGTIHVRARSPLVDLTSGGGRLPTPPFAIGFQVGDDAGVAAITCVLGRRGVQCSS